MFDNRSDVIVTPIKVYFDWFWDGIYTRYTPPPVATSLESANLRQAVILNFIESRISCRNYVCRIAKFGEDILNPGRAITSYNYYKWKFLSTAVLTLNLDLWKGNDEICTEAEHLCQISRQSDLGSFREIRTNVTNERTNQPTNH